MDIEAKNFIWGLVGEELPPQDIIPLEPVAVFTGREKMTMTSGSEGELQFCCSIRVIANEVFGAQQVGVLLRDEFEEVHWKLEVILLSSMGWEYHECFRYGRVSR